MVRIGAQLDGLTNNQSINQCSFKVLMRDYYSECYFSKVNFFANLKTAYSAKTREKNIFNIIFYSFLYSFTGFGALWP